MPDIDTVAAHYGLPADAVLHLLEALRRGGGRQAQFSHPALGGMGQWSTGGMLMIGQMSNAALKAKVAALCADLAPLVQESASAERTAPVEEPGDGRPRGDAWWPAGLGAPSAAGSQNGARYAVFPEAGRLAVQAGEAGPVDLYDTGEHRISGVSQQQSAGRDLAFTSQFGPVRLGDLHRVGSSD